MYGMNPYTFQFNQSQQFGQQPGFPGQQAPFQPMGMNLPLPQQQTASGAPVVLQVATIKQVEQAQVQPGGKALVLVANEPVIAMRTADNMGLTTTDYYHIEKFDPDAQIASAPAGDYVTRAEFQQFVNSLRAPVAAQPQAPAAIETEAKV